MRGTTKPFLYRVLTHQVLSYSLSGTSPKKEKVAIWLHETAFLQVLAGIYSVKGTHTLTPQLS